MDNASKIQYRKSAVIPAALEVNRAYCAFVAARDEHRSHPYAYEHTENNRRWLHYTVRFRCAEAALIRSVNAFLVEVGVPTERWEYGTQAVAYYNRIIKNIYSLNQYFIIID